MKQEFGDLEILLQFKADEPTSNSGVFLRCPSIDNSALGYEVQIYGRSGKDQPTGAIYGCQPPTSVPLKGVGEWNDLDITVVGQKYTVSLNRQVVNIFVGNRGTSGYVGIQNHGAGSAQIRNVRIKDLSAAPPPLAQSSIPPTPNQSRLEILSRQALNAEDWAVAPLDESIPAGVRGNLIALREDLADEGKKKPKAGVEAYSLGFQLCNTMIQALDERGRTLVRAGFTDAQANATTGVSSPALEANRNYMMSWPQYKREQAQRGELLRQKINGAKVMKEQTKLDWSSRTQQIKGSIDQLYSKFRDAWRASSPSK